MARHWICSPRQWWGVYSAAGRQLVRRPSEAEARQEMAYMLTAEAKTHPSHLPLSVKACATRAAKSDYEIRGCEQLES